MLKNIDTKQGAAEVGRSKRRHSPGYNAWVKFRRNKSAVVGLIMLGVILAICITAPLYLSYENDVLKADYSMIRQFPAPGHLLGTDELGRDLLARLLWGGKTSITISVVSVLVSMVISLFLGSLAAYYGGTTDALIMRTLDVIMAIPTTLLMITLVSIMKPSAFNLTLALGLSFVPGDTRFIRAQVLTVKNNEYIEASKGLGGSDFWIILKHIIPNAINPLISQFVLYVGTGIVLISSMSFIGLGIQPPAPEWGTMLSGGREFIRDCWHLTVFPGIAIVLTVTALTLMGDGLRDALDPRMKR